MAACLIVCLFAMLRYDGYFTYLVVVFFSFAFSFAFPYHHHSTLCLGIYLSVARTYSANIKICIYTERRWKEGVMMMYVGLYMIEEESEFMYIYICAS